MTIKHGTVNDVIEDLVIEANSLAGHIFTSQYKQFLSVSQNIPDSTVVQVLDFAQNYRCDYEREVQSTYYAYKQITVHPIINYYRCNTCLDVIREDMFFLTDNLEHNAQAVKTSTDLSIQHLKEERCVNMDKIIQFTDGCSQQYKCKTSFQHISETAVCNIEISYFGARHGKRPAYSCSGVVKSMVRRAVMTGRIIIQNAQQMFEYCKYNLTRDGKDCYHSKRTFHLVEQITPESTRHLHLKTVGGTRLLHQVESTAISGELNVRNLSCYCTGCLRNTTCSNARYVDVPTKKHFLTKEECQANRRYKDKRKGSDG